MEKLNRANLVAADVMSSNIITVRDEMTVSELAAFLTDNGISGAPVVDREDRLVGVVSLTDIAFDSASRLQLSSDRSHSDYYLRGWEDHLNPEELRFFHVEDQEAGGGQLVRDIMTPTVYSVDERTSIAEVARTMVSARLHRLLVSNGHRVVGIVTSMDLLKLLED